ncbi:YciI family protein [Streptomyces clavifer]|uniref:YciI family protein n=1 Tax=Streptomyces clavifer TaxID=68188 RepID=UPI0037B20DA7
MAEIGAVASWRTVRRHGSAHWRAHPPLDAPAEVTSTHAQRGRNGWSPATAHGSDAASAAVSRCDDDTVVEIFAVVSDSAEALRRLRETLERRTALKYVLFVATDPAGEPTDENPEAWVKRWNDRGVRVEGMPLKPAAETRTVRVRGDRVLVTDGPFAETTEWIAGYDLLDATDLDEAIEAAASHPMAAGGRIEIRPVEPLDLGPDTGNAPHEGDAPAARFFGIIRTDPSAPPHTPDPAAVAEWVRDGLASGRYLGGEHLRPVEDATLVRRRKGKLLITDGAYTDVPERVSGIVFIDGDWHEAIDYLARCPMARSGFVELREFRRDFS